jgi:hypothetical protein
LLLLSLSSHQLLLVLVFLFLFLSILPGGRAAALSLLSVSSLFEASTAAASARDALARILGDSKSVDADAVRERGRERVSVIVADVGEEEIISTGRKKEWEGRKEEVRLIVHSDKTTTLWLGEEKERKEEGR